MKQKDIALIIVIVFISGLFSFLLFSAVITPSDDKMEAEVVEPITAEFIQPSDKYFNDKSTNPTQLIRIRGNENETPFNQ